jgi:hypothetical protein
MIIITENPIYEITKLLNGENEEWAFLEGSYMAYCYQLQHGLLYGD